MAFTSTIVFFFVGCFPSGADEISWGDVEGDGSVEIRTLDVPVVMARGTENFFEQDPMAASDWAHVNVIIKSLNAQLSVAERAQRGNRIDRMEEALKPLYLSMPKDDAGLLTNGTVHYILHRFFIQEKGWSIKGLEPAGGTWMKSMTLTPDVKEVSKYMVPTYLQDLLMKHIASHGNRVSLRSTAIIAATLEHLIYGEMLSILYSVYSTIGLSTAGALSKEKADDIIDMFLMVYAFGFNLEVSTYDDMKKSRQHLERKHSVWPYMKSLAADIQEHVMQTHPRSDKLGFEGILAIVTKFSEQYAQFQSRDCNRAKDRLTAMPTHKSGRVGLEDLRESHDGGHRPLFTESFQELQKLGVLEHNLFGVGDKQLIIPNYLNSQSLCLSTVSFYTVCCPNECESILQTLEREIAAPAVEPDRLNELVASRLPPTEGNSTGRLSDFQAIARDSHGMVPLHGRAFAQWMHGAFPLQCPLPNDMATTNPKTPDEWMMDPDERFQDIEDLMSEIATVLANFTAMGGHMDPEEAPEEEMPQIDEVFSIINFQAGGEEVQRYSRLGLCCYAIAILSMFIVASNVVKSGLHAARPSAVDKVKSFHFDHLA